MKKIVEKIDKQVLAKTVQRCRERNIIIPTFGEQRNPEKIPAKIRQKLANTKMEDIDPANLFRITWKNDPNSPYYAGVNALEIPREITGTKARIVGLVGRYFPTGAHKVGAAFGCLVPRLVSGEFDPTTQKAVWPSTGNYCRGGSFDCAVLACTAVAILPQEMSKERFDWLRQIGAEVIATPGCESNVKEIYDKCWEIKKTRKDCVIFNQFEEFGNALWHHEVTGSAIEESFQQRFGSGKRLAAYISCTGSAGTIAAGEYLKKKFPNMKIAASEALQCPTLLRNGFGGHRIEGIGDKHVPWIHNVRNTDLVVAVDDVACMSLLQLFNEADGQKVLQEKKVAADFIRKLHLLGISSIANIIAAIKTAKYYEMDEDDVVYTIFTDSADMYRSRVAELKAERGYSERMGYGDFERHLTGATVDNMHELNYYDRKNLHNLKYFTWVEQQQRDLSDLDELWHPQTWDTVFSQAKELDQLICEFNEMTGLLKG